MKSHFTHARTLTAAMVAALALASAQAGGPPLLGTAFTYQGELMQAGVPYTGSADFQFNLYEIPFGGIAVAAPTGANNVNVVDGVFTVLMTFGSTVFDGSVRYLEIAVRTDDGLYTTLAPRQRITPTPYALHTRGIYVDSGGDVGVGTAAPLVRLHVDGGTDTAAGSGGYLVLGDTATDNLSLDTNEIMARNNGVAADLTLNASGGNVGIGTLNPDAKLHILTGTDAALGGGGYFLAGPIVGDNLVIDSNEIMARNNNAASTLFLNADGGMVSIGSNQTAGLEVSGLVEAAQANLGFLLVESTATIPAAIQRSDATNGVLLSFLRGAFIVGDIDVSGGTVSYNAFTGSHYAWIDPALPTLDSGTLVKMTGNNRRLSQDPTSEVIYGIVPSSAANDPRCMGAYRSVHESVRADGDPAHLVMAVGNGEMWVTESAIGGVGAIQPGDYLIASDIPGCAMKDDPIRFPIGNIVARAAEGVEWSSVEPEAAGAKRAKISVFFESFARGSDSAALTRLVQQQQERIAALEAQLASFDQLAARLARLEADEQP